MQNQIVNSRNYHGIIQLAYYIALFIVVYGLLFIIAIGLFQSTELTLSPELNSWQYRVTWPLFSDVSIYTGGDISYFTLSKTEPSRLDARVVLALHMIVCYLLPAVLWAVVLRAAKQMTSKASLDIQWLTISLRRLGRILIAYALLATPLLQLGYWLLVTGRFRLSIGDINWDAALLALIAFFVADLVSQLASSTLHKS